MDEKVKGNLIIIGGAEDKEKECKILKFVVKETKRRKDNLLILTTATKKPDDVYKTYSDVFKKLGISQIDTLDIRDRKSANYEENVKKIYDAGSIFFTGGDQLRITGILGGTKVNEALKNAYKNGAFIVGTSAGASVMSNTMIVNGSSDTPKVTSISMSPGLGFINEVVIDQHFAQRGRIGRLLFAVAQNPYVLGVGIDEDTAIVVDNDGFFKVIGSNSVTVIDAKEITYSNVSELGNNDALELINLKMHVLASGSIFDLSKREAVLKEEV